MKKAFTMIELVFVIVILGILASFAIPKLSATRDDAEVVMGVQKVVGLVTDFGKYYTAHGVFSDLNEMTDVVLVESDLSIFNGSLIGKTAYFTNTAKTKKCLAITIDDSNGTLIISNENDSSSYCLALTKRLGNTIGSHKFGGSLLYN